ncbi:esterase-like activity of phytase family protein [Roseibium sp. CAU 1637]|uniref:Esterase-like activity of phytase family protein n=1 Tax=Roseibium limicola TaxID=2816037 RepID=A0A939EQB0_9HYPH|nr:esterase-like activity of phytase family protein [Roseibium limicola]MBO0346632.1 esterase-like activity of phytase family protein [Roseibium limicola]
MALRQKTALAVAFACAALVLSGRLQADEVAPRPAAKPSQYEQVTCSPIKSFSPSDDKAVGPLTFIGGCVLRAAAPDFGGLSSLHLSEQGSTLFAATDRGFFLSAEVERDGTGKLIGLRKARLTKLRDAKGNTLSRNNHQDVEGLAISGSRAFISSERNHSIMPLSWQTKVHDPAIAPIVQEPLPLPQNIRSLGYNQGLEALALAPEGAPIAGALLAIGEQDSRDPNSLPGAYWLNNEWRNFRLMRSDRYDATDADFLPNGDLILLERRFNLRDLLGMRLRRFAVEDLMATNAKPVPGEILLEANSAYDIDNMEGLDIHQSPSGETILTLISDDNFSIFQRTLLLEFRLNR